MAEKIKKLFIAHKQFIQYCIVGVANTLITLGLFYVFDRLSVQYILASVLAYSTGIANGSFWSTRTVFKTKGTAGNLVKFILVNLLTMGLNALLLYLFVDKAGIHPKVLAQAFVLPFTFVANFSLNKLWTFAEPGEKAR